MRSKPNTEPRSGLRSWIFFSLLFTLVAGGAWFAANRENIHEYMETYKNREAEIREIANLKQRVNQLKRKQQSLLSLNGVESEKQIRERLGMRKPGERVIFLVDEQEDNTSVTESATKAANEATAASGSESDGAEATAEEPSGAAPAKIRSAYDAM